MSLVTAALFVGGANLAYAQSGGPVEGAPPAALAVPAPAVLLMLVRTTLIALNQANFTGNYGVLHALGTPRLQTSVSPVELGIAFTDLREQRLDLSPVLLLSPELSEPPSLAPDGTLRLAGIFNTTPVHIAFVTVFKPVAGIWRIEGLSVRALPVSAPAQAGPRATAPSPVRKGS